jgi:hypothetical protein
VEELGAMGRSRVEDSGVSLLCTDRGRRHDKVEGDGVALGMSWVEDGGAMEGDGLCDGVGWRRGQDDSERFGGDGLESYPGSEFGPPELDQISGFNSVVGQTG